MMNDKVCHIISHSHWDREWYLPYEKHHVRLVELMDSLLEKLDQDRDFQSFHLDGQTIVLDDYFQIRPDMKQKVSRYIEEGRLYIGPWYILQDEFLTSGEANLRNLQIGHKDSREYGAISKLGYFPDSFGNMGQAPQILRQAGISTAVFGRGVKPTGFNNQVSTSGEFESPYSEMVWQSPDGSSVLGILFANWYNNGMEIPVNQKEAKAFWEQQIANAERFASTNHLLFMNGCDHQPVQMDLSEAIKTAKQLYPEVDFKHSNFDDYISAIRDELPDNLKVVNDELRSQRTDGWGTLVNTASARVYLKQMNQRNQTLLEKVAEPMASFAAQLGKPYPAPLLTYAWKQLMQNHPHDSICGCSIDEVHREMVTRFEKSRHVAEEVVEESLQAIGSHIGTDSFDQFGSDARPFAVFNSSGWAKNGVVSVELEIERFYFSDEISPREAAQKAKELSLDGFGLCDHEGASVPVTLEDLGSQFGYDLPKDRFRQPYMARRVKLNFEAEHIPALGYKTYALVKQKQTSSHNGSLVSGHQQMENEWIKVKIEDDGSLEVTEKIGGHKFSDLCIYEDTGDIGNEYMYKQPEREKTLSTKGLKAKVELFEETPFSSKFKITHEWHIPKGADDLLEKEINEMIPFTERKSQRVKETVPMTIYTFVTLDKSGRSVKVKTTFNNRATDHRLRVQFPTDLKTQTHFVDSVFEVAERDIEPSKEWKNPSNCQHQQAFVNLNDKKVGLTIANKGLNEYEILRDGRNTIAVTLLRSVSELGDWGVFQTPEAQCLGNHVVEYEIIPHVGDGVQSGAFQEAYKSQVPFQTKQLGVQKGRLPAEYGLFQWESQSLALSSMKMNEDCNDLILRWFNMDNKDAELFFEPNFAYEKIYHSNVLEEKSEYIQTEKNEKLPIRPAEIFTIGLSQTKV